MANTNPKLELLNEKNSVIAFIDHQPQMSFGVNSHDIQSIRNNTVGLAKAARLFKVPTILTTVETESFSGYTWPELIDALDGQETIERTSMNSWDSKEFVDAVKSTGRKKLILSGLWSEVCIVFPALDALAAGYEVYFVADAMAGTFKEAHDMAIQRMIQAGAVPVTWQQVILEFQRDWAHKDTYDGMMDIVREHSGGYGMGVDYAYTMVHKAAQRAKTPQIIK